MVSITRIAYPSVCGDVSIGDAVGSTRALKAPAPPIHTVSLNHVEDPYRDVRCQWPRSNVRNARSESLSARQDSSVAEVWADEFGSRLTLDESIAGRPHRHRAAEGRFFCV